MRELNDTLEQRVREQTRERDRVWRNAQDMIVIIDATGTFREVNPAVATDPRMDRGRDDRAHRLRLYLG